MGLAISATIQLMRFLVLFLAACSSGGPCANRQGSYIVDFSERSGNCGPINESIVNIQPGGSQSSCTGPVNVSTDNCTVDLDIRCPLANGETLAETGQVAWNADGSSGSGVISASLLSGGATVCQSTYDVHYQRQ